jgi:hypothetical protein
MKKEQAATSGRRHPAGRTLGKAQELIRHIVRSRVTAGICVLPGETEKQRRLSTNIAQTIGQN